MLGRRVKDNEAWICIVFCANSGDHDILATKYMKGNEGAMMGHMYLTDMGEQCEKEAQEDSDNVLVGKALLFGGGGGGICERISVRSAESVLE